MDVSPNTRALNFVFAAGMQGLRSRKILTGPIPIILKYVEMAKVHPDELADHIQLINDRAYPRTAR